MSKHEKAVRRLLSKPTDFGWNELKSLMDAFGYEMKTTGGSGRKFKHPGSAANFVIHEPHPQSTLKAYQVREFIAFLKQEGHIA
jgi:predicted RNA binding protein YcfA (HicA-like mRNA interferase family)